jgi:hypothetical protein
MRRKPRSPSPLPTGIRFAIALPASLNSVSDIIPGNGGETVSWNGLTVRNLFITPGANALAYCCSFALSSVVRYCCAWSLN